MENYDTTSKSLFNAGVAKLIRIDRQRQIYAFANINKQFEVMADVLENIRNELNERMETEEREKADNYERELKLQVLRNKREKVININIFKEYIRYLGDIEYKYGYSMPDAVDDEGL